MNTERQAESLQRMQAVGNHILNMTNFAEMIAFVVSGMVFVKSITQIETDTRLFVSYIDRNIQEIDSDKVRQLIVHCHESCTPIELAMVICALLEELYKSKLDIPLEIKEPAIASLRNQEEMLTGFLEILDYPSTKEEESARTKLVVEVYKNEPNI